MRDAQMTAPETRERRPRGLVCLALAAVLSFCALARGAHARSEDYAVGEGDVLLVTVFDHPDLTTTARVNREGQIRFPLIGQVDVGGLGLLRIADVIATRLADGFIIGPQVTVAVHEYRTKKATAMGKVARPGVYEFRGRLSFLELLTRAGGLAPDAGGLATLQRRAAEPVPAPVTIDLRSLLVGGNTSLDVEIEDGDVVTVAEEEKFSVTGEVRRPGEFRLEPGMTVLRALTLARGLTERAAPDAVKVIRSEAGREVVLDLGGQESDLALPLKAGDVVTVPEAGIFYLAGEVRRPGEYRLEAGMTVLRAVTLAGGFTEHASTDRLRVIRTEGGQERIVEIGAGTASMEARLQRGDVVVVSAQRAEFFYVTGEVKSTGMYRHERDMTVLKAVTLAGGFTDAAARGKVRIIRKVDGQEQVRDKVSLEEPVLPEDVLIIPRSFF